MEKTRIDENMPQVGNREKTVCLITNHDDDVYCFRKELLEGLIDAGYKVVVSCPYGEKLDLMKDMDFVHEDVYIDRRGTNPIADYKLYRAYKKLMKKYKFHAVLTYTSKPNVYASLAAAHYKIPYINNVTGLGSVINMNPLMKSFVMFLYKVALKKSSCVFFQNKTNMDMIINQGMVKGNSKLLPGSGVNTDRFKLLDYKEGGDGVNGDPLVFNYIGRVLKEKGIEDYIEAATRIKMTYPNTQFNVLGFVEPTQKEYEKLLKEKEEQGIIIYRGQQKDVIPFIDKAHAIIHPSVYGEGMSNVLLENASSGRVLITTNNPGCKETVMDGVSGYIYSGGNVDELVEVVKKFISLSNEERRKMGLAGREYVSKNFSRHIVVGEYLDVIKSLEKDE